MGSPVRDRVMDDGSIELPVITSLGSDIITEVDLLLPNQVLPGASILKHFTGIDPTKYFPKTDGFFQYSIEIEIIDGFVRLIQQNLESLVKDQSDYQTYVALTEIPNIGLVKAGFILQLCLGKVGCIDCHNALKFDVDLTKFKLNYTNRLATKIKKAQQYIELCEQAGGSRKLWNGWCKTIATKYPNHFDNANDVSRVHADAIVSVM